MSRAWRATSRLRTGSSPGGATLSTIRSPSTGPPDDQPGEGEARRAAGERLHVGDRAPGCPGLRGAGGAPGELVEVQFVGHRRILSMRARCAQRGARATALCMGGSRAGTRPATHPTGLMVTVDALRVERVDRGLVRGRRRGPRMLLRHLACRRVLRVLATHVRGRPTHACWRSSSIPSPCVPADHVWTPEVGGHAAPP